MVKSCVRCNVGIGRGCGPWSVVAGSESEQRWDSGASFGASRSFNDLLDAAACKFQGFRFCRFGRNVAHLENANDHLKKKLKTYTTSFKVHTNCTQVISSNIVKKPVHLQSC